MDGTANQEKKNYTLVSWLIWLLHAFFVSTRFLLIDFILCCFFFFLDEFFWKKFEVSDSVSKIREK